MNMNSPYMGRFKVSQQYKPGIHDGLDLVGIDSKDIHATVSGVVQYAGWENEKNKYQGFGLYVCIRDNNNNMHYFGHLSENKVKTGDRVSVTDVIGIEGSTGHSTGSHCHYEIRTAFYKGASVVNVCDFTGIPNILGGIYDDGYANGKREYSIKVPDDVKKIQKELNSHNYNCGSVDGIIGPKTTSAMFQALVDLWLKK